MELGAGPPPMRPFAQEAVLRRQPPRVTVPWPAIREATHCPSGRLVVRDTRNGAHASITFDDGLVNA